MSVTNQFSHHYQLDPSDALIESERRYSAIVNNAPEIVIIHVQGMIRFVNASGIHASGFAEEEIIGHSIVEFLTPASQVIVQQMMERKSRGEVVDDYEVEFKIHSGAIVQLLAKTANITYNQEDAVLAILIDITERKKYEAELNKKDRMLAALAQSVDELLGSRDLFQSVDACFQWIGEAAELEQIFLFQNKYDPTGDDQTSLIKEWNKDSKRNCQSQLELIDVPFDKIPAFIDVLKNGQPIIGNISQIKEPSICALLEQWHIVSIMIVPLFVNQQFWGFVGFHQGDLNREWTNGEIASLNAFKCALQKAIERNDMEVKLEMSQKAAEAANVMKSQFLANMSHEIRTPMNGILGFLDLLQHTPLNQEQKDFVREAKSASDMLLYLINDILDFSKIEAGKMTLEQTTFNIRSTIEDSMSLLMPKAKEKALEIHTMIRSNVPEYVVGDPSRLRQILLNLVGNAIKFTHTGEIKLWVENIGEQEGNMRLEFELADTGIGIASDRLDYLFTPFVQADSTTTRKYGGTGLGLAITKELIQLMHGNIAVSSKINKGTTFIFDVLMTASDKVPNSNSWGEIEGLNVLLVDDYANNRKIVKHYLEDTGLHFFDANSPDDAIKIYLNQYSKGNTIQLAILDFQMPGMNGYQLAKTLKTLPKSENLKLILLTSSATKGDANEAYRRGFHGYLTKPIQRNDLLQCIALVMGLQSVNIPNEKVITKYTVKEIQDTYKPKILLVEDNEMNQKIMIGLLKHRGLNCDIAENGDEAIRAIQSKVYDVVFMDCQMPVMDGYTCTRLIRSQEDPSKRLPIIAMTANAMAGDKEKCIEAGMDDYVSKPLDFKRVIQLIGQYATEREQPTNEHLLTYIRGFSEATGLDVDEIQKFFFEFEKQLPQMIAKLRAAMQNNDFEQVKFIAHQLKGSSGSLKIEKIYFLAAQLESEAKAEAVMACNHTINAIEQGI